MHFQFQPSIQNGPVRIEPLVAADFDDLFSVASDPLIWEQHPNKNRYQREVFEIYFKGALESHGAFKVMETTTGNTIGSSRFYDLNPNNNSISIGYTFLARRVWGLHYNYALKALMLNHAYQFVELALFQVGAENKRSRKAMEKLGGVYVGEAEVNYYGEATTLNVIYEIKKSDWRNRGELLKHTVTPYQQSPSHPTSI